MSGSVVEYLYEVLAFTHIHHFLFGFYFKVGNSHQQFSLISFYKFINTVIHTTEEPVRHAVKTGNFQKFF